MNELKRNIASVLRKKTKSALSEMDVALRSISEELQELCGKIERRIDVTESIRRVADEVEEIFEKYEGEYETKSPGQHIFEIIGKKKRS